MSIIYKKYKAIGKKVKNYSYILLFLAFLTGFSEINASNIPPKRNKSRNIRNSCTISSSKFSGSDQIEYHYGVVAGLNFSTIKSNYNSDMDIVTGVAGGLAAQIVWPMGFMAQPEILFSKKGCIFAGNGLRYDIDYLEVPVKLTYRFNLADVKPFGFVAPYAAYVLNLTEHSGVESDDTFSDQINKLDYGFSVGAGFDVWRIQLSFRYIWGLAQVADYSIQTRNRGLNFSAGVFF